jgi:hypothetical protein
MLKNRGYFLGFLTGRFARFWHTQRAADQHIMPGLVSEGESQVNNNLNLDVGDAQKPQQFLGFSDGASLVSGAPLKLRISTLRRVWYLRDISKLVNNKNLDAGDAPKLQPFARSFGLF